MTRTSLRARIAALTYTLVLAVLVAIAISTTASAQAGCCSTYSITIQAPVPASCFPITVDTRWSNGLKGTSTHTAPGTIVVHAPIPPGCRHEPLLGLMINGVPIPFPTIPPPGCLPTVTRGGCT